MSEFHTRPASALPYPSFWPVWMGKRRRARPGGGRRIGERIQGQRHATRSRSAVPYLFYGLYTAVITRLVTADSRFYYPQFRSSNRSSEASSIMSSEWRGANPY